jgi:hypothetical protein
MSARCIFNATIPAATLQSGLGSSSFWWVGADGSLVAAGSGSTSTTPPSAQAQIRGLDDAQAFTITYDSPAAQTGLVSGSFYLVSTTVGAVPPSGRIWLGGAWPIQLTWTGAAGQISCNWGANGSSQNFAPGIIIAPVTGLVITAGTWPTTASNLTVQVWAQSTRLPLN